MKLAAILLALCIACVAYASTRKPINPHDATLRLTFEDGICSGTAVGPHTLLSARHCFNHRLVSVNGQPVVVGKVRPEGRDAVTADVDMAFPVYAQRGPMPVQGDRIRIWGNPLGEPDVMRVGYVARAWTDGLVLDMRVCFGDSGAGVWDDRNRVVAVISATTDKNCNLGIAR